MLLHSLVLSQPLYRCYVFFLEKCNRKPIQTRQNQTSVVENAEGWEPGISPQDESETASHLRHRLAKVWGWSQCQDRWIAHGKIICIWKWERMWNKLWNLGLISNPLYCQEDSFATEKYSVANIVHIEIHLVLETP